MALLRSVLAPALICFLGACSVDPKPDPSAQGDDGGGGSFGQNNAAGSKGSAHAGTAGRSGNGKGGGGTTGDEGADADDENAGDENAGDENAGNGGEGGDGTVPGSAGTGSNTDPPPAGDPLRSCELEKTCGPKCGAATVTCGVISTGVTCEMEGFAGATLPLDVCGERAVVGTACCGGCGCVPVELFFDGHECWQGIPNCELPQFTNLMFAPHPPSKPNPSFVPPDSQFHLGSGGLGGAGGASGTGGKGGRGGSSGGP